MAYDVHAESIYIMVNSKWIELSQWKRQFCEIGDGDLASIEVISGISEFEDQDGESRLISIDIPILAIQGISEEDPRPDWIDKFTGKKGRKTVSFK